MKKIVLLLGLSTLSLFAYFDTISSYKANFVQTVVDSENVTIVYKGSFTAKRPFHAVWSYTIPTQKSVYINDKEIVVVEPELEQAIERESKDSFTLFNILEDATKVDAATYEKTIGKIKYTLTIKGDTLHALHYQDDLENNVTIMFKDTQANIPLKSSTFHPVIPEDYDIISQ